MTLCSSHLVVQRNLLVAAKNFHTRQGELPVMKNFAIRTFVVALAVAGFSASSMYSASTARKSVEAKTLVAAPGLISSPSTQCAPGSTCGLD